MDFLDPKHERRQIVTLYIGYVLIAIAIIIFTIILLYRAYGFGLDKNGDVIQSGFLFVSSQPANATIKLNGKNAGKTNDRLSVPSGPYKLQLQRSGYRQWQQAVTVQGGVISRYDYSLLIPSKLTTTTLSRYTQTPGLATQSPDRRWLLVQQAASDTNFDMYDLKNPKQAAQTLRLPATVVTASTTPQSYQLVEWANDNQHVLLKHTYDTDKVEYILLDRSNPDQSQNLSTVLGTTPTKLNLINKKYDHYYLYDATNQTLRSASLNAPTPVNVLDHVLNYKSYGDDMILYASSLPTPSGKITVNLLQDGKTYTIRSIPAGDNYLLELTRYSGAWYVALGTSSDGTAYIYKNPVSQLNSRLGVTLPIYILRVANFNYLSFSPNTRFTMIENGSHFAVFDAEYDEGYNYDSGRGLDAPQPHAGWLDGNHLSYVSGGQVVMFDFDHGNPQTLTAANPAFTPFFSPDYSFMDTISADGQQSKLGNTYLLTANDR